jgi:hypothetical protein
MDYEFTITINGEVHKVKGNTTNGIPYGNTINYQLNNECFKDGQDLNLAINDITEANYVSGQNLNCIINFPNFLLGTNQARVSFSGGYFGTLSTSLGGYNSGSSFMFFSSTPGIVISASSILPITVTDLGTTSTEPDFPTFNFGQTVKGNYSGTIYIGRQHPSGAIIYDIPVQLSIDFKALRKY